MNVLRRGPAVLRRPHRNQARELEDVMKNGRKDKTKGTLRPWLVDVVIDHLR